MSQSQTKEQVAIFYEEFQKRGKYDYLYGGDDRKNLIVRLIGKGKSIIEVGCRAGNLTQHYAEGNRVVGVDIDRNALKLFEERLGLSGHWLDLDSERLPFDTNSFDLVVFSEVMEHLRFPQSALAEIHRVLRPEGSLVGSVPNAFRLRNRLRFLRGRAFETDPSHLRSYSSELVRGELSRQFAEVQIFPISGHLLGGGSTGVPVFSWLPFRVRALFALDLVFMGVAKKASGRAPA